MWYFAWCLGIGFAILLGVVNALWGEYQQDRDSLEQNSSEP
ncbi:cytochrome bd-I oxidase subunit CydX [Snodgrassella sp. CS2]